MVYRIATPNLLSLRGGFYRRPHPFCYPLGLEVIFSDDHPRIFYRGVPPRAQMGHFPRWLSIDSAWEPPVLVIWSTLYSILRKIQRCVLNANVEAKVCDVISNSCGWAILCMLRRLEFFVHPVCHLKSWSGYPVASFSSAGLTINWYHQWFTALLNSLKAPV